MGVGGGGQEGEIPPLKVKPYVSYVVKYEFQNSLMYCVPPLKPKIGLLLAHVWEESITFCGELRPEEKESKKEEHQEQQAIMTPSTDHKSDRKI